MREMLFHDNEKCLHCGGCVAVCPQDALIVYETHVEIKETCNSCGLCVKVCPLGAMEVRD